MTEIPAPGFNVNGRFYPIPAKFNIGEMVDAERFFGVSFDDPGSGGFRMAAAVLWISMRREDASVSVEDVRNLPPETFAQFTGGADAGPPDVETTPSSDGNTTSSGIGSENTSEESRSAPRIAGVPG